MNWIIAIIAILISAQLWRMGGNGQSLWRNPGVPVVIAVAKFFILGMNWWALLYILLLYGAIQAFSYGKNAPITKAWYYLLGNNPELAEPATRATCGFLWSLPALLFAFLTGTWLIWAVYALFLTISNALVWYYVDDVEINERLVGACVATAVLI